MRPLLEIKELSKFYGEFAANDGINLSVKEGSIHAIVGENGAGKSTLMNIIAGVIQPTSGKLIYRGDEIILSSPNDATKHKIGMVQQEFMLFDNLTVLENIIMGHEDANRAGFLNLRKSREKIKELCRVYNFDIPLDQKVSTLPIAIRQQVEIIKVLFRDADLIILDEPTAVLTPQGIEGLFRAMRFLVKRGKTILFITHKLKEVLAISDHISVLKDGKLVSTIATKDATERKLAELMVGREVFLDIARNKYTNSKTLYQVENVCVKNHKGQMAVKNISFELKTGEVVGIVGIAGNGQSELVEALFGIRKLERGRIVYKGQEITNCTPHTLRKNNIAYIPQDRIGVGSSIVSNLVDNAMMGKHTMDFNRRGLLDFQAAEKFAQKVIDQYEVKTTSEQAKAGSLSGGNLQKLIVGREFSQGADLLIIEDPTRGIDIGSMEFIWKEIVRSVEQEGKACLLISYDLSEVMALSDRILIIYKGQIIHELPREDFDEKTIGYYMLGGESHDAV